MRRNAIKLRSSPRIRSFTVHLLAKLERIGSQLGPDFTDRDSPAVTPDKQEEQPQSKTVKPAEPKGPPRVAIINQTMARLRQPAAGKLPLR